MFDVSKKDRAAKNFVSAAVSEDKKSPGEVVTLSLRIEVVLLEKLKITASENERSVNGQVVTFIKNGLKDV